MTIRFSAILLVGTLLLGGCTKDYLDLNDNPNQTTNPPLNGLLARVTSETGLNVYRAGSVSAYYVQQLSSPNASSGSDTYDNVDRSTLWYNIYNTMQDGRVMLEKANAVNAYQHIGVSKVMEAMNLDLLVDFWGDAPYSQAFDLTN
ncbi:MAG: SusD/RagB family nutrient-binding outer membrane lipoprotein, partial [Sphingobacteriales bacterium]